MLKKWLSAYNLQYPYSIVYMLQASEYKLGEYFSWLKSVEDFKHVEKRKKLVKTKKSTLLILIAWMIVLIYLYFCVYINFVFHSVTSCILSASMLILLPFFLACVITIPLYLIKIFIQTPITFFIIKNARKKLRKNKAVKIAVAGSYGKTTMREILKVVLSEGKKVAAPPHNHNTLLGISKFISTLRGDEDIVVFELGEYYPGDIKELCELVTPDIGVITGINEAHLEKFKTLENTTKTIYELADYLGERALYVNGENKLAAENHRTGNTLYSREGVGDWIVKNTVTDLSGTTFELINGETVLKLKSKLLGLHQVGPLAAAAVLAFSFGLSKEEVERGINNTKAFDHRLEAKTDGAGVTTLDDSYNGNPDGVRAVIEFLGSLKNHRKFYVTPGLVEMGPRTIEVHKNIGKKLSEQNIDKVILIRNSVTGYIEQGLIESGYKGEIIWFDDAIRAFSSLKHLTVSGDVVLLQNDWPDQYK